MKGTFKGRPNIVTPVMEERIILVAYEDGNWFDRMIVHHVRKQNSRVEALYQEHRNAVREVRIAAGSVSCPDSLGARLHDMQASSAEALPWYAGIGRALHSLQALSAVTAMVVMSFMVVQNLREPSISDHELRQATLEAKASLALISNIMNGTRDTMHRDVILERTSRPLRESIFKGTETIKNNL